MGGTFEGDLYNSYFRFSLSNSLAFSPFKVFIIIFYLSRHCLFI